MAGITSDGTPTSFSPFRRKRLALHGPADSQTDPINLTDTIDPAAALADAAQVRTGSVAVTAAAPSFRYPEGNSGSTPFIFTLTRSTSTSPLSVNWALQHGTTSADDFVGPTSGTVNFSTGETSKTITVNVAGDLIVETDEIFSLVITAPVSGAILASISALIQNDDSPALSIAATSATKAEGNAGTTPFTFMVTRSSGIGTSSANWALQHGTTSASDFTGATSGTVTFASGETSKLITINVVGDLAVENNEAFSVLLSSPSGATLATASAAGIIQNDDAATLPTLSISATSAVKAEGSTGTTPFTFTVTRSSGIGVSSVDWALQHGRTSADDFTGTTSGTLTFAPGETSKLITLNVVGDRLIEDHESFAVVLGNPIGATLATASAEGVIRLDDGPLLSVAAIGQAEGDSGTTPFTFTIDRSDGGGALSFDAISLDWELQHITTNAADFTGATTGTISFAAGETSKSATVNVVGDLMDEGEETFAFLVRYRTDSGTLITLRPIGSIYNDDYLRSTLSIAATSASKAEGNTGTTPFTFTITRSSSLGTASVNWGVVNGSTTSADFSGATSGVVSFAAGETSKVITINVVGDTVIENSESFSVRLSTPVGATLSTTATTAAGSIVNDDLPTLSIAATSASKAEGTSSTATTPFTFTVTRSSSLGTSTANWSVVNGTTTAADFSGATSGVVSFAAGQTSKVITVNVVGDTAIELNEAFSVALSGATGATIATGSAAGTITNDDQPVVGITATSASKAEGNTGTTPFTFIVTRSSGVGTSSVNWAVVNGTTATTDFSGATNGVVSFAAGETSKVVTVNVVGDTVIENSESFSVRLSTPVGATLSATATTATGTIVNDDLPALSIAATSASKAEGSTGTTPFTFTVTRTSSLGTSTANWSVVNGTTTAADFSGATSGVVSFAAGETSKVITVNVVGDTNIESNEAFSVALSGAAGATIATGTAAGTILNDDVLATISIAAASASKAEGNSGTTSFTFTVTRSNGVAASSVNWAVAHGTTSAADFSGATSGTIAFAAGETSKVITLNVVGDTAIESSETFSVALSGVTGATLGTASASGTIINDDSRAGIDGSIAQTTGITVPAEVADHIDNLVSSRKWGGGIGAGTTLTYSFSNASSVFSYTGTTEVPYTEFNAAQKAAAISAMNAISKICNITFVEVADTATNAGDIRWTQSLNTSVGTAYGYYPSSSAAGGDMWFGPNYPSYYGNPVIGTYGYATYIHELGHAMGLAHPHTGTPAPLPGEDQLKYSIMSYMDYAGDTPTGYGSNHFPTTYMINDIAALQYLYGANTTTNAGNTTYSWAATAVVEETLWDTGGTDTLSAAGQTLGATLNLNAGAWSSIGVGYNNTQTNPTRDTLTIAYGSVIENATGSAQADTLIGNDVGNVLTGGAGADALTGGAGADTFRFVTTSEGGDAITDLVSGTDKIQVVSANFGALPVGTLATSRFVSSPSPAPVDGNAVFLYNPSTGVLTFDSNGTGAGGLSTVATLGSGYRTLGAGDIQVVAA